VLKVGRHGCGVGFFPPPAFFVPLIGLSRGSVLCLRHHGMIAPNPFGEQTLGFEVRWRGTAAHWSRADSTYCTASRPVTSGEIRENPRHHQRGGLQQRYPFKLLSMEFGMKGINEKRRWSGYPKDGLTLDEAATFLQRLEAGKSISQLTRGASNPDYLVPVPRYLVHRKNDAKFRAMVDYAIVNRPSTWAGRAPSNRREAFDRWRSVAPGLSPEMAGSIMIGLRSGERTIAHYTRGTADEHYLCSYQRFQNHCALNPEWGAEAWQLSKATTNRLKSENNMLRKDTMCRNGLHELVGSNLGWRKRGPERQGFKGTRFCIACTRETSSRAATPLTDAEKAMIRQMFNTKNVTLGQVMHGKPIGGGAVNLKLIVASPRDVYHARATDPEFGDFIARAILDSNSRGQRVRHARAKARIARAKAEQDAKDYFAVQNLIPRWFPEQDKFDVVNDVMAELSTGKITRDQLRDRIKFYMGEANKMFAPKFRKFGEAKLVSLDELVFDDGTTTIGDNVSRGLWD
jgi:hypothetical protein